MIQTGKIANAPKAAKAQPPVQIITSVAGIKALTNELKATGAKYQQDLHRLACSILAHTAKHGQINVLAHFLESIPDAVRVNSVKQWMERYGMLTFAAAKEGEPMIWRIDRSKKLRLAEAMINPFWKQVAQEGVAYVPLDIALWLEGSIKKLENDAKKGGGSHNHLLAFLKTYDPMTEVVKH